MTPFLVFCLSLITSVSIASQNTYSFPSSYLAWQASPIFAHLTAQPYSLINSSFSDFASKERIVYLPDGLIGQDGDALNYPDGAVIEKHFYYLSPTPECSYANGQLQALQASNSQNSSSKRCLIETRILFKQAGNWQPFVYHWLPDQTNALAAPYGATQTINFVDNTKLSFNYSVPNLNECRQCHQGAFAHDAQLSPIGPRLKSRIAPSPHGLAKTLNIQPPKNYVLSARHYLDINCAHCHNPNGTAASSGLFLRLSDKSPGFCKPTVATGVDFSGLKYDVVPGKPASSILLARMASRQGQIQMPEIGSALIDPAGIELVSRWIANQKGRCNE